MKRKHFPIRSAFAVTCDKSQGQSLSRIGLYLDRPMFSHGQLYIGLRRVGSPDNIRILLANETSSDSGTACTVQTMLCAPRFWLHNYIIVN